MRVSPGVAFLAPHIPIATLTVLITYATLKTIARQTGLGATVPTWFTVLASLFSVLALVIIRDRYDDYVEERDATRLGAVLLPKLIDSSPAGFKTSAAVYKNFNSDYPGVQTASH